MGLVVSWKNLIALIDSHYPKGKGIRPAYLLMAMLSVHLIQNWARCLYCRQDFLKESSDWSSV